MIQFFISHTPKPIKNLFKKKERFPLLNLPNDLIKLTIFQLPIKDLISLYRTCKAIKTLSHPHLKEEQNKIISLRKTMLYGINKLTSISNGKIIPKIEETNLKVERLESILHILKSEGKDTIYYIYPEKIRKSSNHLTKYSIENQISLSENIHFKIIFNQSHSYDLVTFANNELYPQTQFLQELHLVLNFIAESSWISFKCSKNAPFSIEFAKIVWTQRIPEFLQSGEISKMLEKPENIKMLSKKTRILRKERFKTLKIKSN